MFTPTSVDARWVELREKGRGKEKGREAGKGRRGWLWLCGQRRRFFRKLCRDTFLASNVLTSFPFPSFLSPPFPSSPPKFSWVAGLSICREAFLCNFNRQSWTVTIFVQIVSFRFDNLVRSTNGLDPTHLRSGWVWVEIDAYVRGSEVEHDLQREWVVQRWPRPESGDWSALPVDRSCKPSSNHSDEPRYQSAQRHRLAARH